MLIMKFKVGDHIKYSKTGYNDTYEILKIELKQISVKRVISKSGLPKYYDNKKKIPWLITSLNDIKYANEDLIKSYLGVE